MAKKRIIEIALVLFVAVAAGGPALARKPDALGNSGTQQSSQEHPASAHAQPDGRDSDVYFNEDRRILIRNFYARSPKSGDCPPGLARKNNGCHPPGQLKKWRRGEPLPSDVVYQELPDALIEQLGRRPEGRQIIQVDSDVLLISTATGLVLDAFDLQE